MSLNLMLKIYIELKKNKWDNVDDYDYRFLEKVSDFCIIIYIIDI